MCCAVAVVFSADWSEHERFRRSQGALFLLGSALDHPVSCYQTRGGCFRLHAPTAYVCRGWWRFVDFLFSCLRFPLWCSCHGSFYTEWPCQVSLSDDSDTPMLPSSLMLLNTAHEYLGRRSLCCNSDGSFLKFYVSLHNVQCAYLRFYNLYDCLFLKFCGLFDSLIFMFAIG